MMRRLIPTLTVALLLVGGASLAATTSAAEPEKKDCCFSNPRYTGQCKVTPGPDEKCSDILAYLNAQNSVGKSYCGNTIIRGGWTTVTCEDAKSAGVQQQAPLCSQRSKIGVSISIDDELNFGEIL